MCAPGQAPGVSSSWNTYHAWREQTTARVDTAPGSWCGFSLRRKIVAMRQLHGADPRLVAPSRMLEAETGEAAVMTPLDLFQSRPVDKYFMDAALAALGKPLQQLVKKQKSITWCIIPSICGWCRWIDRCDDRRIQMRCLGMFTFARTSASRGTIWNEGFAAPAAEEYKRHR